MNQNYQFITAWGRRMGSSLFEISRQLGLALTDNAPATAIYRSQDRWFTIEEVSCQSTRRTFINEGLMTPDWKVPAHG